MEEAGLGRGGGCEVNDGAGRSVSQVARAGKMVECPAGKLVRCFMRFSIRELLLLTAIVSLIVAMLTEHVAYRASVKRIQIDITGTVNSAHKNASVLDKDGYFLSGERIYRLDSRGELVQP